MLRSEKGNALFLILIAVALFGALSYAVTQSGRGSGTIDRETDQLIVRELLDYGALVRATIMRMTLTGTSIEMINTCSPDLPIFSPDCNSMTAAQLEATPFSSTGGGIIRENIPANVLKAPATMFKTYEFLGHVQIPGLGTDAPGNTASNEIMLIGGGIYNAPPPAGSIKDSICKLINQKAGLSGSTIPVISGLNTAINAVSSPQKSMSAKVLGPIVNITGAQTFILGTGGLPGSAVFDGKLFGCFRDTASNNNSFFYIVAER